MEEMVSISTCEMENAHIEMSRLWKYVKRLPARTPFTQASLLAVDGAASSLV